MGCNKGKHTRVAIKVNTRVAIKVNTRVAMKVNTRVATREVHLMRNGSFQSSFSF